MVSTQRLWPTVAWAGIVSLAIATAALRIGGKAEDALVMAAFTVISAGLVAWRLVPGSFALMFIGAAMIGGSGFVFGLFDTVPFYDKATHTLAALAVAVALGTAAYRPMRVEFRAHPLLLVLAIATFGIAVGTVWEFYEYAAGIVGSIDDTLWDLICDTGGATAGGVIVAWREALRERRRAPRPTPVPAIAGVRPSPSPSSTNGRSGR